MEKDFKDRETVVDTSPAETAEETKTATLAEDGKAEGTNNVTADVTGNEKNSSKGKIIAFGIIGVIIVLFAAIFIIAVMNNSEKKKVPQSNEPQVVSTEEKVETTDNVQPSEETTPVEEATEEVSKETVDETTGEIAETEKIAETDETAETAEEWASQPDNDEVGLVIWSESKGNQFVTDKKFSYEGATDDEKFAIPYRTAIMKILVNKEEPALIETESGSYYEINVTGDKTDIMLRANNPDGSASAYVYYIKK
mgnify:CR=1 FL=1